MFTLVKNSQFGIDCNTDSLYKMYKIHKLQETNCLDFDNECFVEEICSLTNTYTCNINVTGSSIQNECPTLTVTITTI